MHARHFLSLAVGLAALLSGCSDKPGVLQMTIHPAATVIDKHSLVTLRCELKSDHPICLAKNYDVEVRMHKIDEPDVTIKPSPCRRVRCGNEYFALLPLVPAILAGQLLDVADLGGRFVVVKPGDPSTRTLAVGGSDGRYFWFDDWREGDFGNKPRNAYWSPGKYRVTVAIRDFGGIAPLFWKPYSHPVRSETTIQVLDTTTQPVIPDVVAASFD